MRVVRQDKQRRYTGAKKEKRNCSDYLENESTRMQKRKSLRFGDFGGRVRDIGKAL